MVLENLFRRPSALARFRRPPLGPELDGFCGWLERQGFSRGCLRRRVWQVSHFNQVLRASGVTACAQVQFTDAQRFLSEHVPHCRCRDGVGYSPTGTASTIRALFDYLSQRTLVAGPPSPCAPLSPVLEQYLDYLRCERNLSANTVKAHHALVTPFLDQLGVPLMERLAELSPQPLLAFFTQSLQDRGLPFTRRLQGVLRCFLRFCLQQDYLQRDLAEAIPAMRSYKLARVPHAISNDQAQATLACTATARYPVARAPHPLPCRQARQGDPRPLN
jgi:integrase/recombinase XerC